MSESEQAPEGTESTEQVEASPLGDFQAIADEMLAENESFLAEPEEPTDDAEEVVEPEADAEETQESTDEEPDTGEGEGEGDAEPGDEGKETNSAQARRRLAKEAKLRTDRKTFDEEQEKFSEKIAALDSWESSKAEIGSDPIAHLEASGLSGDDMLAMGREIFLRFLPENQDNDVSKAALAAVQRERRLAKLERNAKKPDEENQAKPDPKYVAYETEYKTNLQTAAESFNHEKFPLIAKHVEAYEAEGKDGVGDVYSGLWAVATQSARQNDGQGDLSPDECMGHLESYLGRKNKETSTEDGPKNQPNQTETAPIRNKQAAIKKPKKPTPELSDEEFAKARHEEALAMLSDG